MSDLLTQDQAETNALATVAQNPVAVLTDPAKFDAFYDAICREARALSPDLTTPKGRSAIAAMAHKVARTKTAIDAAGKALNESARKQINAVDEARRDIREKLDALRDEVRQPLTDWEAAEERRVEKCQAVIASIRNDGTIRVDDTAQAVAGRLACVVKTEIDRAEFADFYPLAVAARDQAAEALRTAHARLLKEEADRAELARLRAEAAAREEADRIAQENAEREEAERLAAEQAERDRIAATEREAKRKQEAEAAEAARIERARKTAAEEAQRAAERKAREEQDARDKAHAAELARLKKERDDAEAKHAAEAKRIAAEEAARKAEAARIEAEAQRRAADRKHRGEVMRVAKEALMEHAGLDEDAAKRVVLAISGGNVPSVQVRF